jgi:hypothetical protein
VVHGTHYGSETMNEPTPAPAAPDDTIPAPPPSEPSREALERERADVMARLGGDWS